ncbi:MAG TPA: M28 family peptidase [Gemmatimonadaceae bacterium]|nr:M28 family peptidase [Gemmatimonadaceae bacterium]
MTIERPFLMLLGLTALVALAGCEHGGARTAFDGTTALGYVKTQLDFGTRVPGTEGARKTGDWIVEQMKQRADTVIEQRWTHVTVKGDTLPLRNILARFRPDDPDRVLYVTHWDTRPVSDGENTPPGEQNLPMPGANDGGSGVALFIALGDVLKKTPPTVGVDLLFVDGEDYGSFNAPPCPHGQDCPAYGPDVLIGSAYFAKHLPSPDYHPLYGVLWDMIGDANLDIYQEPNSMNGAPEVVTLVWGEANKLGYSRYFIPQPDPKGAVIDDHIPLLQAGLRVIDVLDIDYPYHHTPQDTLDKLSAQSLQVVGDVATALVTQ